MKALAEPVPGGVCSRPFPSAGDSCLHVHGTSSHSAPVSRSPFLYDTRRVGRGLPRRPQLSFKYLWTDPVSTQGHVPRRQVLRLQQMNWGGWGHNSTRTFARILSSQLLITKRTDRFQCCGHTVFCRQHSPGATRQRSRGQTSASSCFIRKLNISEPGENVNIQTAWQPADEAQTHLP